MKQLRITGAAQCHRPKEFFCNFTRFAKPAGGRRSGARFSKSFTVYFSIGLGCIIRKQDLLNQAKHFLPADLANRKTYKKTLRRYHWATPRITNERINQFLIS